jgi:hypothetical protein
MPPFTKSRKPFHNPRSTSCNAFHLI